MNRNILILISAACVILAAFSFAQAAEHPFNADQKIDLALAEMLAQGDGENIPVIVMLKENANSNPDHLVPDDFVSDILPESLISDDLISDDLTIRYRYRLIPGLAGEATAKAIKKIAESDRVSGIYFDGRTEVSSPDENLSLEKSIVQGEYISPAQIINADKLWEKGIDGQGTIVAVIDSGIDKNHPDLIGKVVAEKNFLADEITTDDLLGHGTMVAGIIAGSGAASNGRYKGIAPGAKLISVKVIDGKGDGKVSDIIAGIEWAIYSGADVLSLSLGGINLGETNPPITMAADNAANAGVVVCVAAGNRNSSKVQGNVQGASSTSSNSAIKLSQVSDSKDKDVLLLFVPIVTALPPGLIDSPGDGVNVITVGAADAIGHMASFSGSGPTRDDRIKPDVVAPGVDIISIVPSGVKRPNPIDIYYSRESGTSLSAPVAAGLSALLLQANGNLTPAGVKAAMTRGAKKLNNTQGETYEEYYQGAGMLDALSSYQMQDNDICGVIPDQWTAGRWAYLPAGQGVYVGLDTGADRPQKKIYALAPGDEDWNLRFVFFSNQEIKNLKTSVNGAVSDWVSLQALPNTVLANDQKVFAASITVPQDAEPGIYNGTIEITNESKNILSIPVSLAVAEPLNISKGQGNKTGSLNGNGWHYYYLDIMPGTSEFDASLEWQEDANLDLFLLSPTSEYYSGEKNSRPEKKRIESPPSGRWLLAVHNENSSEVVNYTLEVERSKIESIPQRWNLQSAYPGTSARANFLVENVGGALENLSYIGVTENTSFKEYEGSVGQKEVWNITINVTERTRKLSARLSTDGKEQEVLYFFENPQKEPVWPPDSALGSGDLGPIELLRPEPGLWKIQVVGVSGFKSSDDKTAFKLDLLQYVSEPWNWISIKGPERIESDSNESLEVSLTIPDNASQSRIDGYIEISSDKHDFEIPVSVTIAGTRLEGLTDEEVLDSDNDGRFDVLTLGFDLNITAPGEYRLKGVLADCSGNRIEAIDSSFSLKESASILVNVSGVDIWRNGKCGPMMIQNLILYDKSGSYIDRFDKEITINREPKQFQPPAAYLTGEYVNRTAQNSIAIGVNVTVIKPGRYELQGIIEDDVGEKLGEESVESDLAAGNATILLQFDPTRFMKQGEVSAVHLVDLVLSREGGELERMDYAWSSEEMDPQAFEGSIDAKSNSSGPIVTKLGNAGAGALRVENGTIVIS
ncbi:MAG TPA: S8 family peptidase [Methanothrix sp.]|nr:S8 family peptidase [Methanothrix sp.]